LKAAEEGISLGSASYLVEEAAAEHLVLVEPG
jgi:hypothetical protein